MTTRLRPTLLAAVFLVASSASAQATFSLHNPTLIVDGQHLEVQGAPLSQYPFTYFYLSIPDVGTYIVAGHSFDGAQRVGVFNDTYLELSADGHDIQLWSTSRLLSANGLVGAFARLSRTTAEAGDVAIVSSSQIGARQAHTQTYTEAHTIRGPSVEEQQQRDAEAERLEAERLAAQSRNVSLTAEVQVLRIETAALANEIGHLRAERERLSVIRGELSMPLEQNTPSSALTGVLQRLRTDRDQAVAERDEYALTTASLRRDMTELESRVRELREQRAQLMLERLRIIADRDQVIRERDALHREAERLRNESRGSASSNNGSTEPMPEPPSEPSPPVAATPVPNGLDEEGDGESVAPDESDVPYIQLAGFDYDRLENPREVLRFIDDVEYPRLALMTRAAGDVLVLFVTDDDGWVIRAEVAEPIGSGLDIVAEQIVRTMHFKLQSVEDLQAALHSQVTVAFNR